MKTFILGMPLAIAASLAFVQPARTQVSVGVGRPGVSVNTPYFSFQYGRAYPSPYVYRPHSYYDVPFYGNWYGLYRTIPPMTYERRPVDYGWRYAPSLPNNYGSFPRRQPAQSLEPDPNDSAASVRVLVPKADAQIWFDDTTMRQIGTDRQYVTPPLDKEKAASYRIRAAWTENGRRVSREKSVSVTPGQETVVDFNDEAIP